ncbi:MAG: shikimate dehydrogenase [Ilumatobacteraceae bacterium]|jgi:shikimate dehydrogenase|nr:shikimate dehydrogenase [Ilumatobacteraceae bacterium]MDP5069191.1 shikimate dehydrogenase [Ilumatobacteraceae bacterium]
MSTIAAVIGSPISHSLSPAIHNAAFAASRRDGEYVAVECGVSEVESTMESLQSAGLLGLSVTMPLKETVIDFLDFVTPDADFLNAVNCISFGASGSIGHNTDGDGCCDALIEQGGVRLRGATAVLLGAGGTARSIALALVRRGAHVVVVNRTQSNALDLVNSFAGFGDEVSISVGDQSSIASASILVNATSVGMNSSDLPIDPVHLHSQLTVLDAVYSPLETSLLVRARETGATVVDGLWMLIHQARHQQKLWFGEFSDASAMRLAAERELSARRK